MVARGTMMSAGEKPSANSDATNAMLCTVLPIIGEYN